MPEKTPSARTVARRLLSHPGASPASNDGAALVDAVAAAEQAGRHLAGTLARWFGPFGYHALLTRALAGTKSAHPALGAVVVRAPLDPVLDGLAEAARTHGDAAMTEAVADVLTTVIDVLGRLIGEDMALNLVEQSVPVTALVATPAAPVAVTEGAP